MLGHAVSCGHLLPHDDFRVSTLKLSRFEEPALCRARSHSSARGRVHPRWTAFDYQRTNSLERGWKRCVEDRTCNSTYDICNIRGLFQRLVDECDSANAVRRDGFLRRSCCGAMATEPIGNVADVEQAGWDTTIAITGSFRQSYISAVEMSRRPTSGSMGGSQRIW